MRREFTTITLHDGLDVYPLGQPFGWRFWLRLFRAARGCRRTRAAIRQIEREFGRS